MPPRTRGSTTFQPVFSLWALPILKLAHDMIELSGLRPDRDVEIEMTRLRPGDKLTEELIDSETESLTPTPFDKIRLVTSPRADLCRFREMLATLEEAAWRQSEQQIYEILTDLGIGFQPGKDAQKSSAKAITETDELGVVRSKKPKESVL